MENGTQMTLEQWMPQACPKQTAGVSEHHARTFQLQENVQDWEETDRALYEKFLDSWKNKKRKTDLNGLSMKMLRECFLATTDSIIYQSSLKWTRGGYDIEWQNINSRWFVPQNRERIYTIGHLRRYGSRKIFPITGTDGENSIHQLGALNSKRKNSNAYRVYDPEGISPTLNSMQGGGREPHIVEPCFIDLTYKNGIVTTDTCRTIQSRYFKGPSGRSGENSGVCIPVLTPDRANKRQNVRRFKDDGEPEFTLTAQDRHGVAIKIKEATKKGYAEAHEGDSINFSVPGSKTRRGRVGKGVAQTLDTGCNQGVFVKVPETSNVYAVWYEKYQCYVAIRKLTTKECFRLQGWTDDYFEKAQFVNSDSQLYKQAGNGVTVDVVKTIGDKIC